jgi:hypothetical protein
MTVKDPKMSKKSAAGKRKHVNIKNCHVLRQENGVRMKQNQTQIMINCTFLWYGQQISYSFLSLEI